jgi:excisionase family DNA binding protein
MEAHLPELPQRLLTIAEAADYLNVPLGWVRDAVQQRRIRCTRIGKHVRFTPEHLAELILAGESPLTPSASLARSLAPRSRRSRL